MPPIFLILFAILVLCSCGSASGDVILLDDFDSGSLNADWTPTNGTWLVSSGRATQSGNQLGNLSARALLRNGIDPGDSYSIQADIGTTGGSPSDSGVGITVNMGSGSANNTFWIFPGSSAVAALQMDNGFRNDLGAPHDLGFTPLQNHLYTMRIDVTNGTDFTLSVKNGVGDTGFDFVASYSDTFYGDGTWGLSGTGGGHIFDNVKASFATTASVPEPSSSWFIACLAPIAITWHRRRVRSRKSNSISYHRPPNDIT